MMGLGVTESVFSSAAVIEGGATFTNGTFVDCFAHLNVVSERGLESRGGAIAVIGGGRLTMQHCTMQRNIVRDGVQCCGGALLVSDSSSAELVESELTDNLANASSLSSNGGAVCVRERSSLRVVRSMFAQNVADGSNGTSLYASGGAFYLDTESTGEVNASDIVDNAATDSLGSPCGGAFYVEDSRLAAVASRINRNIARGGVYGPSGGAIFFSCWSTSTAIDIADCEFLENVAQGGAYANAGTSPHRVRCAPVRALRIAATLGHAGVLYAYNSRLKMSRSVVKRNKVVDGGKRPHTRSPSQKRDTRARL
jgi:hypothetical protein